MRAAFGLVSLLVVAGIVVWWMAGPGSDNLQTVATAKKSAEEQTSQIAGLDSATGGRASESASLDLITMGGKPDSVLVTSVVPGGAYERHFGLQANDAILEIGALSVKDNVQSLSDAEAYLSDAFSRQWQLTVVRDGERITLPQASAARPAAAPERSSDPLQQQLDGIGARRGL